MSYDINIIHSQSILFSSAVDIKVNISPCPMPSEFPKQHSETSAARARGSSGLLLFVAMNAVHRNINVVQQLIVEPQLNMDGREP